VGLLDEDLYFLSPIPIRSVAGPGKCLVQIILRSAKLFLAPLDDAKATEYAGWAILPSCADRGFSQFARTGYVANLHAKIRRRCEREGLKQRILILLGTSQHISDKIKGSSDLSRILQRPHRCVQFG
jgi:hypothetical protein